MTHSPPAHSHRVGGKDLTGREDQQVADIGQDIQAGDQGDGDHQGPHQVLLQSWGEEATC